VLGLGLAKNCQKRNQGFAELLVLAPVRWRSPVLLVLLLGQLLSSKYTKKIPIDSTYLPVLRQERDWQLVPVVEAILILI